MKALLTLTLVFAIFSSPMLFAQEDGTDASSAGTSAGAGSSAGGGQRMERAKEAFAQLDLTDAQKAQIKQIRASTQPGSGRRQQIMAVLTPEQKAKLVAMLKEYRAGQSGQ